MSTFTSRFPSESDAESASEERRFRPTENTDSSDPADSMPAERDPLRRYLTEIARTPLLTIDEEITLAGRIRNGDAEAREHMIRANLRLVVRIARDYQNYGLPLPDLISEGNIGLVKAVERFNPGKGGKLSTYAAWWIRQALRRALASHSKIIRLPMHMADRLAAMRRIISALVSELGREPADDEIARVMRLPVRKITHLRSVGMRAASLDAPLGEENNATLGDLIGDDSQPDPLRALTDKTLRAEMDSLLAELTEREAEVIRLRFGLVDAVERTLEEVGAQFGVTRERVRQLQHHALIKLRHLHADSERRRTPEDRRDEARKSARTETLNTFFRQKHLEQLDRDERIAKAVRLDSLLPAPRRAGTAARRPHAGKKIAKESFSG